MDLNQQFRLMGKLGLSGGVPWLTDEGLFASFANLKLTT